MRYFFAQEIKTKDDACTITGPEARHMVKVLRMQQGDRFILMDGNGNRFQGIIDSIGTHNVQVIIENPLPTPPLSPIEITLCQALLRSQPMDYIVQKTSELGVHRIIPFVSERTIVRPNNTISTKKVHHWQSIARSAAKQSGSMSVNKIHPVIPFQDMLHLIRSESGLKIILWEEETAKDLKNLIHRSRFNKQIIGIIGPEGGFSRKEIEIAEKAGFIPLSLGRRILRAETAAITLAAIFQFEWGDLSLSND